VLKDLATFSVGLGLIIHEGWFVPPGQANIATLLFAGVLINVPGASQLLAARTGSPVSPDPPEQSSLPPPPSSTSSPGADR